MKHKLFITIFTLLSALLWAQESAITIHTTDQEDGKDIPFCHVCIRDLGTDKTDYFLTDDQGKAKFIFSGKAVISISFMGYKTIIDTISNIKNTIEYEMEAQSFDFDEVVVTGQNKPVSVDKSIYNIKLIGKKEIEQTASTNLTQLLSKQVNIQINNDPSLGSSLKLQGISGENIKILVDNVPVIGRMDGSIDLSQINLSEVDHIEIVEGPMSVIYGSNALGGVINIITKENRYARIKAGVDLYYESVGVYNVNANANWKKGKNAISGNFGRNFFQGFSVNPNSRYMDWKPKEQYTAGFSHIFSTEKIKIKTKLDGFKEKILNRNNPDTLWGDGSYYLHNAYDVWYHTSRLNASIHGDYQLSDLNSFKSLFSYSYYDRETERYSKELSHLESTFVGSDDNRFNAIVARGTYNRHTLSEVLEYQMGFDINWENAIGDRIQNETDQMADYAAFIILKWRANEHIMIQPALRAAYNTKYNAPLAPSINAKFNWRKNQFRLSYARGFRAPSLKELYLDFTDSNHELEGNPDLEAENSHNFNLAYHFSTKIKRRPFDAKFTLFYNQIFNQIKLIQVDPGNAIHYRNENIEGQSESLGGTLGFTVNPLDFMSLELAYSNTGVRYNSSDPKDIYFNSDAVANLVFLFLQNTLSVSINYKYVGAYPNLTNFSEDGTFEVFMLDSYHNLDVNLSKKFFNNSLTIGTGVKNIFDNVQIQSSGGGHGGSSGASGLIGWGRTAYVSLKYNFIKF